MAATNLWDLAFLMKDINGEQLLNLTKEQLSVSFFLYQTLGLEQRLQLEIFTLCTVAAFLK